MKLKLPKPSKDSIRCGWTVDWSFLLKIQKHLYKVHGQVSLEDIEQVILALKKVNPPKSQ